MGEGGVEVLINKVSGPDHPEGGSATATQICSQIHLYKN